MISGLAMRQPARHSVLLWRCRGDEMAGKRGSRYRRGRTHRLEKDTPDHRPVSEHPLDRSSRSLKSVVSITAMSGAQRKRPGRPPSTSPPCPPRTTRGASRLVIDAALSGTWRASDATGTPPTLILPSESLSTTDSATVNRDTVLNDTHSRPVHGEFQKS